MFYKNLRIRFVENVDYIIVSNIIKATKGVKLKKYMVTLETFERICMTSRSKRANSVRDYGKRK